MKLTHDPMILKGQTGETISVDIQSSGTSRAVVYSLNGADGSVGPEPLIFTLIRDPTFLELVFDFDQPKGGLYVIRITGSLGGDISTYTLTQSPNPGTHATLVYKFQVDGGLGGGETKSDY